MFCFLILCAFVSHAQKKTWYLGGAAGFSSTQFKAHDPGNTTVVGKNSSWTFSPEVGTFISDHVQVGVGLTFTGAKSVSLTGFPSSSQATNKQYGGTLYARHFWGKQPFKPFAGVAVAVLPGRNENISGFRTVNKTMTYGANINAGFSYALNQRIAALGSFGFLGYNHSSSRASNSTVRYTTSSFGLDVNSLGNRFTIGFYYSL